MIWLGVILFLLASAVVLVAQTTQENFVMTWTAPDKNTDGSPLLDLDGYYLCMKVGSPIPDNLGIPQPGTFDPAELVTGCTANFNLEETEVQYVQAITLTLGLEDILYVRIAAYDTSGNVSVWSDEALAAFDKKSPAKVLGLTLIRTATP